MNAGSHLSLLATLFVATTVSGLTQSPRPMVVDDLFHLQTLGDIALSPDGELLAIVIQRAWSDPETFRPYDMLGNDQADVWILPTEGGPPTNVTRDASDESGYWNPVWSPDGQRLALLSTAGGDNVRLYMWDRRSGRVQRMSERGVDLRAGASANADGSPNPIQWVDDRRLLVSLLPEGEQPVAFRLRRQTPRIASEEWVKAGRGLAPTSSVLESGFAAARPTGSVAQLVIIDVVTDVARVLVEDSIRHALLSPDREHVAVIVQDRPVAPEATRPLPSASSGHSRLGIIGLRNGSTVQWVDRIFNPTVGLGTNPHRWSPSGSKLAVLASDSLAPTATKQVFVISPQAATALKLAEGFTASALAWSGEQLLTLARPPGAQRSDWWKLPAGQPKQDARKLTGDVVAVPAEIFASVRSNEVIGIADGEVWSFDLTNGSHQNLTGALGPRISSVVWPREDQRHASPVSSLILRAHEGTASSFVRVELAMSVANASSVPQPAEATTLAAYHLERRLVVFTAPRNPHGSYLWTGRNQSRDFARRIALNDHLAGIAEAERKLIEYRSADGQDLKGVILLPVGYEPGKRYPLVTWVYPGFVVQDTTMGFWVNKNQAHMDNLHILAGQGYAVLIPSMPSKGRPRDPYHELPSGVLPAVDRVIALGIVDPERVAVMGQSAGGFATYGLITQTTRFKAAVAISGYANLASNYGAFRGDERYTHGIDEKLTQVRFSEGDVIGLGAPPWQDADRYTRNSPVFFLNRVETPLLILHGDLDYVPLQQAEEVFTNLYRLGKRVRFVRYWGEGHGVGDSAANIRDRWHQILDWLGFHMPAAR